MSGAAELDETHDPDATSWVEGADGHRDFPPANLPFGVFSPPGPGDGPRGGIRIGDQVLDLSRLAASGLLGPVATTAAQAAAGEALNALFALGAGPRRALRREVHALLATGSSARAAVAPMLHPVTDVSMSLPARIGDYTDFYVGIHHARAVGSFFRPDNPLLPNYHWLPIGYHGRASSIVVDGHAFRRPTGQLKDGGPPVFEPTRRLDFELELAVWIGPRNELGEPVPIADAATHVAGFGLLNDWSARDVQAWEYQPLGPFLAKNFASTVSAWVITPEALAPFRGPAMTRATGDPQPLPHLSDPVDQGDGGLGVELEVLLQTAAMRGAGTPAVRVAVSSTSYMYWTVAQMITHHTSGGCNLRPGDLLGSGTLSGPDGGQSGSLLEATDGGRTPITLPNGEQRLFLADGDEVVLRARAIRPGFATIGFGDCRARVRPA